MGQEPKSSRKGTKIVEPDPSPPKPSAAVKKKPDATNVELVSFAPSAAAESNQPSGRNGPDALFERTIRRWTIALGVLAVVSVVLLLGPRFYRSYKAWRATQLALQGEDLVRKKQFEEAIPTIRSAFILSPNAPEVLRVMAQALTAFKTHGAMTYWNWLLQTPDATDDDRRAAADCAMQNGLYNQALILIEDLLARNGKNAANQLLAAQWCSQRGTTVQTMLYATRAVDDDPTNKTAVLFLAIQELPNNYLHQDAVDSLFKLADSDNDSGLMALRHLAMDASLKPAEIDRLIARLRSHPLAGEPERLAALNLEIKLNPGQRSALIDQAIAFHQTAAPADIATFAEWLNTHDESERVLKLIPRERALSNKDIFGAYIDALGALNRWADLKTLLSGARVPLEVPFVELYLSRCDSKMGDDDGSDLHWHNAVSAAAYNPSQSLYLALYAEKLGQNERAATIYQALTQEPVTARIAYLGLLRVLSDKDTRTQRDLLEQMVTRWPHDDEMATQYVFLNLILNEKVQEMHQRALKLFADDSYSISHRTNVALACLRLNDPAGALKAYRHVLIDWSNAPVADLVVYAATIHANGDDKTARQLLFSVNRHTLRPELRDLIKSVP